MLKGSEVRIIEPNAIRDWIYIADTVEGYLHALDNKNAIGEAFNLCSGTGHTAIDVVNIIRKFTNSKSKVKIGGKSNSFDPKILIGNNSKAFRLLGWKPKYSLEKGLEATIRSIKSTIHTQSYK
jgi:nucleoside-diphosphate-sugar epimerase